MGQVRLLPPQLADKIAAGEVVERPASAIKELVENSLDAGASRIQVQVEAGGLKSILVRDDGTGLDEADARLALQRHATSKINDEADLFRVRSLGFRGEALPAIASVSRLTLITRRSVDLVGIRLEVEGGLITAVEQAGGPPGTTVEVRDLFYNTPARLKFVKSIPTEAAWTKEAVIRLALARPEIHFDYQENGRPVLTWPAVAEAGQRLADLFGAETAERLLILEEDHPAVRINGWLSPPEETRASANSIYLYVNRRYIRDKTVLGGLLAGYQGRLERGRYPLAALYLEVEPGTVDVNVHPAKLEVRFHHGQAIRQALVRAVARVLARQERTVWVRPDEPEPLRVAEPLAGLTPAPAIRPELTWPGSGRQLSLPARPQPGPTQLGVPERPRFRYLGTYGDLYLVGQVDEDLVLIDQHAAHERLIYDRLGQGRAQAQPLLQPQPLTLTPRQAEVLLAHLPAAQELGLGLEPFGPDGRTVAVTSLPALLAGSDPARLVADLAEALAEGPAGPDIERIRLALARLACHQAVKAGQELTPAEAEALVEDLGRLSGPLTCPHGRPIVRLLTRREIDRRFGRT